MKSIGICKTTKGNFQADNNFFSMIEWWNDFHTELF